MKNIKKVKIICAWCGVELGFKNGVKSDADITHSICKKCDENLIPKDNKKV